MYPRNHLALLHVMLLASLIFLTHQECKENDEEFLVTFHPHLDAFWLNSDEQLKNINFRPAGFLYAMNQRNSKTIFNSMLKALLQSPSRKYFVTEVVFFKDWYDYLSKDEQKKVAQLLKNGQLQIGNGGWVENDEAICYYDDILDQYTIGMNFLHEQFKYQTTIAWATDSFGHSHSQAALEHLLGVQFQGIERIDDRYLYQHKNGPLLEFYWQAVSDSNNRTYGGVLNQVRHFLHEVNNLRGARKSSIESDFQKIIGTMRKMYGKNKFFRFLGNDFEEFITEEFVNLEESMRDMNGNFGSCPTYKYGNPTDYLNLIKTYYSNNKLPTRKYDFMPNWDQDRYWNGYYTSDPNLKKICKDYSRIVNLFRKVLLKKFPQQKNPSILEPAEELLAVMQHHDGITATSKSYIQDSFKTKMGKTETEILNSIDKIYNISEKGQLVCRMYSTNNVCQIKDANVKTLYIITQGNVKKERVEVKIPPNYYFGLQDVDYDLFCENNDGERCVLVFEAVLSAGMNEFMLKKMGREQMEDKIHMLDKETDFLFSGRDYHISLNQQTGQIKYEFNDGEFIKYSFHSSPNSPSSRQTMSWNKYGDKTIKTERVVPGIYIMSNTGTIQPIAQTFSQMKVAQGSLYIKVSIQSNVLTARLTIKIDEPNIVDFSLDFKPPNRSYADYFVKMSSGVKSDVLYHDSNGYLVSKREKNKRPDYDWEAKREDLINANTYPACTFAYLIQNSKKFLFFSDRAQGVAMYDNSLLINIDRLDMDDGKGVGEGWTRQVQNTFNYKTAIISEKDNLERLWQRSYDEASIAYFRKALVDSTEKVHKNNYYEAHKNKLLKYTMFYLNDEEIVLRLNNLEENENMEILKYRENNDGYEFDIEEVGLSIKCKDIKESYANGLTKVDHERKHYGANNEINNQNSGLNDKEGILILRPLEIRSFRINFKNKITISNDPKPVEAKEDLTKVNVEHGKTVHPTTPRLRCF